MNAKTLQMSLDHAIEIVNATTLIEDICNFKHAESLDPEVATNLLRDSILKNANELICIFETYIAISNSGFQLGELLPSFLTPENCSNIDKIQQHNPFAFTKSVEA